MLTSCLHADLSVVVPIFYGRSTHSCQNIVPPSCSGSSTSPFALHLSLHNDLFKAVTILLQPANCEKESSQSTIKGSKVASDFTHLKLWRKTEEENDNQKSFTLNENYDARCFVTLLIPNATQFLNLPLNNFEYVGH
jgi:hypothetical protein